MSRFILQLLTAVVGLLAAISFNAVAAPIIDPMAVLIDQGNETFDTRTGRHWLNLSQSTGLSYDTMKAMGCDPTCTVGRFAGWTFAQAGDVRGLVESAGLPYGVDLFSPTDQNRLALLISLLGGDLFAANCDFQNFGCGAHGILNRVTTTADLVGTLYNDPSFVGTVPQAFIEAIICCGDFGASDSLEKNGTSSFFRYAAPLAPDSAVTGADDQHVGGVWLYRVPEAPSPWLVAVALVAMSLPSHSSLRLRSSSGR